MITKITIMKAVCLSLLLAVSMTTKTTIANAVSLPDKVFWDNEWPTDLTLPNSSSSDRSSDGDNGDNDQDQTDLWLLQDPHEVTGQTALNTVGNDAESKGLIELYSQQTNNEVRVRTWNGAWVGNVYLPSPNILDVGSKFEIRCGSGWGVNILYNNNSDGDESEVSKVNYNQRLVLVVLYDDVGGQKWYSEEEYIPKPTEEPTQSPTLAPTTYDEKQYELLEATVLFAQSQIIPSKHGIENDNQPHLTALRKTLVMMRPHKIDAGDDVEITMTVRDVSGNVIQSDIAMADPTAIPKQAGWIELGETSINDIDIPTELNGDRYIVQGQNNLNKVGGEDDSKINGLTELLNSDAVASKENQVEIKTADGSWVRRIYLPEGPTVPSKTKIQITCNSGYNVELHYPNTQTGFGYRSTMLSNGQKLVAILVDDGKTWVKADDLVHNDYVFGHNFYTSTLNPEWVQPGMSLEFRAIDDTDSDNNENQMETVGVLDDIKIGGATELMITTLDAGFLTEPRNRFSFRNDPELHNEYFETTTASRLIVVQYEPLFLEEIMLPTGKFYERGTISDTDGGWHSGDMRQYIGKVLLSHGIDYANYGISSSKGSSESGHPYTCALLAAHNTVGMYQNGRQVHGGSGGNGMVTLDNSKGNEFSHEVGHNYGLGHYVDGFEGSVHRPADEINSSWGWDSRKNIFTPNFSPSNTGRDQCVDEKCQSPFDEKYQYGKDSMAGGAPQWGSTNRYTMYTPNTSKKIQQFLEKKAVWDPSSETGFRKYDPTTGQMEEFVNTQNNEKVPRLFRVPVTTVVGYYDPDPSRNLESYIYPALHGAYGFVYDDDDSSVSGTPNGCELVVETNNNGVLVFDLSTTIDSSGMNKFHVNIATKDEPYEARIFCQNELRANRALDSPNNEGEPLTYTVSGIPFESDVDDDNLSTTSPTTSPTSSPTDDFPTFNPTELESTASPTDFPTFNPTNVESSATPSLEPTKATTTLEPTEAPTTMSPTVSPTEAPTTMSPTVSPTEAPTTMSPTVSPTEAPTTISPTASPTATPTKAPTTPAVVCEDSTEKFKWNNKGAKRNCKWLSNKNDSKLKKFCKAKKQKKRVHVWCPQTCGRVDVGKCAL